VRWIIDGNNVFGSRPDGWWNDRQVAATRFAQQVAVWCRTHDDDVAVVFDAPVSSSTVDLAGGNLTIVEAPRRGRNAADDHIVELVDSALAADDAPDRITVVTSDRGLRRRLAAGVDVIGAGRFLTLVDHHPESGAEA